MVVAVSHHNYVCTSSAETVNDLLTVQIVRCARQCVTVFSLLPFLNPQSVYKRTKSRGCGYGLTTGVVSANSVLSPTIHGACWREAYGRFARLHPSSRTSLQWWKRLYANTTANSSRSVFEWESLSTRDNDRKFAMHIQLFHHPDLKAQPEPQYKRHRTEWSPVWWRHNTPEPLRTSSNSIIVSATQLCIFHQPNCIRSSTFFGNRLLAVASQYSLENIEQRMDIGTYI